MSAPAVAGNLLMGSGSDQKDSLCSVTFDVKRASGPDPTVHRRFLTSWFSRASLPG